MRAFLRDVRYLVLGVLGEFTIIRFQLAEEHGKQRRLAAAVGTDHTHTLSRVNLKTGVLNQDFAAAA